MAVDNVSFQFAKGERLGIAGETGSGKSTLLKIISGFEQADSGAVYFNENKVFGPNEKLIPGHPGIAYLSQHFELRNHYRVEEILEYATLLSEEKSQSDIRYMPGKAPVETEDRPAVGWRETTGSTSSIVGWKPLTTDTR